MKKSYCRALIVALLCTLPAIAELPKPENPYWTPVADEVYLQEVSRHVLTDAPVLSAAVYNGQLYTGDAQGVARLKGDTLQRVEGPTGTVTKLEVLSEALWAATDNGLWKFDDSSWTRIGSNAIADVCVYRDGIVAASGTGLYALQGDILEPLVEGGVHQPIRSVANHAETLYVHSENGLGVGLDLAFVYEGSFNYEDVADWGKMPYGADIRDMLPLGGRLYVATDRGLAVLRGMTWYHITGEDGLPYEDTTCLTPGFAKDLWIGTKRGAVRYVDGDFHYFGYKRWLPHDNVNAIAIGDRVAYVATDGGLGIIEYEPYTLRKKAAWYERWMEEWGVKRLGFTHKLIRDRETGEYLREVSDNDIGYSVHYFAAKCYEYAVTGDPAARAEAIDMMKSVKWSEEISTIDGFPARSIWQVGEKGIQASHGSGGLPAEWHRTPDDVWEWKGDTSSDETDAHNFVVSLFLELVATEDSPERAMAIEHLHRVFGHITDRGFYLRDVDGKPTRWARWDPQYLLRPYGYYARGLNGMEIMSYLTTADHFTGDEKFLAGKEKLLGLDYAEPILRQKNTFHPDYFTFFDDRLAFFAYYPLLRYEIDPDLRALWMRSLERSWEVKRIDGIPWYNYIYGAITGNDCENERSAAHLREWPLDVVVWSVFNSHRDDLHTPEGYRKYSERVKPLSPREAGPRRVSADWMQLDIAADGGIVSDPSWWIESYWMGRYFGFIEAPATDDPKLLSVPKRNKRFGATPYVGPPRPELPLKKD
jgi:hypothetical protein